MLGTPQAEQYARKLLADIEASPMGGGTRLLWAHAVPFYQAPVRERLNFSAENQLITCDMNADTLGCYMDPDKPFESMAARLVNNIFNGSAQHRIQRALELCRMQQIDGVVYFCQMGLQADDGGRTAVQERTGSRGPTRCCCWTAMAATAPTRWTARPPLGWMLSWRCCTANRRRWYEQTIYYACKYAPLELFAGYGATFSALDPLAESFFLRGALRPRQPVRLRQGCAGTGGAIRHPGFGADQLLRCHAARFTMCWLPVVRWNFLQLLPVPHQSTPATRARFARDLRRLADALQRYTGQEFDAQRAHAFFVHTPHAEGPHLTLLGAHGGSVLYDTVQKAFALPVVDATCTGNRELADVAPRRTGGLFARLRRRPAGPDTLHADGCPGQ